MFRAHRGPEVLEMAELPTPHVLPKPHDVPVEHAGKVTWERSPLARREQLGKVVLAP